MSYEEASSLRSGLLATGPALPQGIWLETAVSSACSVIAAVTGAFLHLRPDDIGLHCGAAEIDDQWIIFLESHRAGKSTLTCARAAAGYRVFGDDVVALTPERPGDDRYSYLALDETLLACTPNGT